MAFSTGLNVLKGVSDLEDHLERLQESPSQYAGAETPSTGEYFYHTGRSRVLSNKALESKPNEVCESVAVEETLSSGNLVPVNPGWDGMDVLPELGKNFILVVVMVQSIKEVCSADMFSIVSELFVDLLDLSNSSSTEFITLVA
jgi:hypothetical protein